MMLEKLRIPMPCDKDWEAMDGNERERHCAHCERQVLNLSELTRAEIEDALARRNPGQRICARISRDPDGNIITRTTSEERLMALFAALARAETSRR